MNWEITDLLWTIVSQVYLVLLEKDPLAPALIYITSPRE